MAMMKWDPWHEMEDLFDRYSRAMGWPRSSPEEAITAGDWSPRVDIAETEAEFVIKAEVPEVKKEDLQVTVENGIVTLRGERKQEKEEKGKKFHRIERYFGSFHRRFTLPENVDEAKVQASFKDGVLTLKLPKSAETKAKKIEVKVE